VFVRGGTAGMLTIPPPAASDMILRLNRMEFKHLGAKYLAESWWEHGFPNLHALAISEAAIIERLVASAGEVLEVRSNDPSAFASRIAELSR
jgi:hypothetical protein